MPLLYWSFPLLFVWVCHLLEDTTLEFKRMSPFCEDTWIPVSLTSYIWSRDKDPWIFSDDNGPVRNFSTYMTLSPRGPFWQPQLCKQQWVKPSCIAQLCGSESHGWLAQMQIACPWSFSQSRLVVETVIWFFRNNSGAAVTDLRTIPVETWLWLFHQEPAWKLKKLIRTTTKSRWN
jgi:hypothetical protein